MANENIELCMTCTNSILCPTWTEVKCMVRKQRIHGYKKLVDCKYYKKRPKNFKESSCQCEDCLKNPLVDVVEE